MSVETFRTIVIQSKNQILGGFGVDRLGSIFRGSICERNIFECFQENCREGVTRVES